MNEKHGFCILKEWRKSTIATLLWIMPLFAPTCPAGDFKPTKVAELETEIGCALSDTGSDKIFFGLSNGEIVTLQAPYKDVLRREKIHSDPVSVIIQVSKGKYLSGDFSGNLFAWTPGINKRTQLSGHEGLVSSGGSFDGITAVTGDSRGNLIIWDLKSLRQKSKHTLPDESYLCVCRFGLRPDRLLISQSLGPLRIVKLDTLADLHRNNAALGRHLCISVDNKAIFVALQDGTVVGLNPDNLTEIWRRKVHLKTIRGIVTIDDSLIGTTGNDGMIAITDWKTGKTVFSEKREGLERTIAYSEQNKTLVWTVGKEVYTIDMAKK